MNDDNKELIEIAKNSKQKLNIIRDSYDQNVYDFTMLIKRKIKDRFKESLKEFYLLTKKHFEGLALGVNGYIETVNFLPDDTTFVHWEALKNLVTKEEIVDKVIFEKSVILKLIEGEYLINEKEYLEKNLYINQLMEELGLNYPNQGMTYKEIDVMLKKVAYGTGSWQQRRDYIDEIYSEILEILKNSDYIENDLTKVYPETGWKQIDRDVKLTISRFEKASDTIEFKAVTNMLRDILEKISNEVYEVDKHQPITFVGNVSNSDIKRKLEGYFKYNYKGKSNDEYLNFAISTVNLVNKLVHSSSQTMLNLRMGIEATLMLIRIINLTNSMEEQKLSSITILEK